MIRGWRRVVSIASRRSSGPRPLTSCPPNSLFLFLLFFFSSFFLLLLSSDFLSGLRFTRRIKKQGSMFWRVWKFLFARGSWASFRLFDYTSNQPLVQLHGLHANDTAQPPLFFKELDYGLLKCRLVRRGVVVAVAFAGACRWDFFEKPVHLLIRHVGLPVEYQDRHVDFPERFRRPGRRDRTSNDGRKDLRISSRHPRRYQSRRREVPRNDFSLLQDFCPFLRPHPARNRTRHRVWHRPILGKFENTVFERVVPNPGDNRGLHPGAAAA